MLEWRERESAERIAGSTSDSASAGISPNHSGKLSTILSSPPITGNSRHPPNLSHHSASPTGGGEHLQSDAAPSSPRSNYASSSPRGLVMGEAHSTASMFAKLKLLGKKSEFSGACLPAHARDGEHGAHGGELTYMLGVMV